MLTPEQTAIIKATVPLLETGGEALTTDFYKIMLGEHPGVMVPEAVAALQAKAARIAQSLQLALFFKLDAKPRPAKPQPCCAAA